MNDMHIESSSAENGQSIGRNVAWRYALYLAAYFLAFTSYWMNHYFGRPDLDQILYHLNVGAEGLAGTDPVLIRRFIRYCVVAPLLLLWATIWFERSGHGLRWTQRARLHGSMPAVLLGAAALHWMVQVDTVSHVLARFGPDYFAANYIPPERITIRPVKPKNLVLIYVESLEADYRRADLIGSNLLAPLDAIDGVRFGQFRQTPGTGWTIAALVATQCALPLKRVTLYDENTQGEAIRTFLPNATCLGDILAGKGYRNIFMGGASATFAGKGKFLSSHGYQEVYGKEDWLRAGAGEDQLNGWGLYDGRLIDRAKLKVSELQASGQPFNLTLLTVNTHEPRGHLSRRCAARGFKGFEGVVGCVSGHLAEFVAFMEQNGYMDNTNVIILGDHLARKNPLSKRLASVPERTIFNLMLSRQPQAKAREEIIHFDLLPTILAFSGFDVAGGRLGLGYNAFDRDARPQTERFAQMQESLMNRSHTYLALWAPSTERVPATVAASDLAPPLIETATAAAP